ncbi:hypothetical protein [Nocardia ninae]|nr:hypothetical protein [Nocardia ninae]
MELIAAVTAIDGATGWMFWALAGSTARAASMLPEDAVTEVFGNGQFPLIAYDERPYDNVIRIRDGLAEINGTWRFGTGVSCADWVVAIAHAETSSTGTPLIAAIVPTRHVEIIDSWNASGLSGTGTVGYRIDGLVVPELHTWPYPPSMPVRGGAHFISRRAAIKHLGFALGLARSSLEWFTDHVIGRQRTAVVSASLFADLARARLDLDAAYALGLSEVSTIWIEAVRTSHVTDQSYLRLRAVARRVTEIAMDVCALAARYGDASMLARQNPLQRNLRDITAAAAHAEVSAVVLDEFGTELIKQGGEER